jgi:hypothetical protein
MQGDIEMSKNEEKYNKEIKKLEDLYKKKMLICITQDAMF